MRRLYAEWGKDSPSGRFWRNIMGETMDTIKPIYIVAAKRSPIGRFGGSLKDTPPIELAGRVARAAIKQSGLKPVAIAHAVVGHVIHTEGRDMYMGRAVAHAAGLPPVVPAVTVNRLCGSGLQAIVSAANMIGLGDADAVLAGGVEVMSRGGYLLGGHRWGQRMGDGVAADMMLAALTDPFGAGHMGVTAENIAKDYSISRKTQDAWAARSQARALAAQQKGLFADEITPIPLADNDNNANEVFVADEHIRAEATAVKLAQLKPVFQKGGSVTAGNAAGINDGAAMLVLANEAIVKQQSLKPLARIVGYGYGGVEARLMGMGPVPATRMALARAGLEVADLALIESNEAFAAQTCAVNKALGLPEEKTNVNGGAIALGHPIGATGAVIATKLIYELRRRGAGGVGLATMCIGGGQGISLLVGGC